MSEYMQTFFTELIKGLGEFIGVEKRAFLLLYHNFKRYVSWVFLLSALSATVPFITTGGLAYLVNSIIAKIGGESVSVMIPALLLIFANILPQIISVLQDYFFRLLWLEGGVFLNLLYSKRRIDIDIGHYENPKLHDMIQKVEERGIWPVINLVESQTANLSNIVGMVVASAVLISINWSFLLVLVIGTLPRLYLSIKYGKDVWSIYDANPEERRRFSALKGLTESVTALSEIRIHQIGGVIQSRLSELLGAFTAKQVNTEKRKLKWTVFAMLVSIGAIATVFWLTIRLAFAGEVSVGAILFVLTAVREFEGSLERFFAGLGRMYEWHLFTRELFRLFDLKPFFPARPDQYIFPTKAGAEIVFENVTFRYPLSDVNILSDVSLTIKKGSTCALVGQNGAGKSTIVKLLAGFYVPTEGRILINGIDLKDIEIESWYKALGVLFQEHAAYDGLSISDGIKLGREGASVHSKKINEAGVKAGADQFISAWPHGYESIMGKRFSNGVDPSRGQLQRLALARIFYRSPRFVIFDEPTAAVDAEAEEQIFHEIMSTKDQTRLLISHRFSTVRNADQIIILDAGEIRERGTHDELMSQNGTYARLFRIQAKGYSDGISKENIKKT